LIRAGDAAVLCSHWQGFYGMHNDDRRGFRTFQTVVRRLKELDPLGERTRWRKVSEITNYACAREMATITVAGDTLTLDLPVRVPELTLRIHGTARGVWVDGAPLREATTRAGFATGTFYVEGVATLIAFDPTQRQVAVRVALG